MLLGCSSSISFAQTGPFDNSFKAQAPPNPAPIAQNPPPPVVPSPIPASQATVQAPSPTQPAQAIVQIAKPVYSVTAHNPVRVSNAHARFDSMIVDADKKHLFAAHPGSEKVAVLNLSTGRVTEYQSGPIDGIAIDTQDGKIFMAGDNQQMRVIDRQSLVRIDQFLLNGRAGAVVYNPDNHRVYVDHFGQSELWIYDAKTHQEIDTIGLDGQPGDVVYSAATDMLYQSILDKDAVDVIDPATNKVALRWTTAPATNPVGIAVDPLLHKLLVAGTNGRLVALDSDSGAQIATTNIAANIAQIAYDSTEQRLFCASGDGVVSVVQVTRDGLNYLGDFKTHAGAQSIALNRTARTVDVWVSYSDDSGSYLQCFSAPK